MTTSTLRNMADCTSCEGTGRDRKHRYARFTRLPDALDCSLCGDHGWDWSHGDCPSCGGTGTLGFGGWRMTLGYHGPAGLDACTISLLRGGCGVRRCSPPPAPQILCPQRQPQSLPNRCSVVYDASSDEHPWKAT